ncbi:MAG: PSD1 and planctomycete cytochrome C domain-containing protein [Verrucomicrobia bacterium]|nr:PSD1 and planctomycete cytochrome C domain-containing protein [Verrucomicrobiota bacterium]
MPLCVRRSFPVLCVMFVAFAARAAHAAPKSDATFYESKVRPILEDHCFDCHGEDKQKNKLRLDSAVGILRGGESGEPLLVRGVSAESYIIKRVTSANAKEVMPPKGERLTAEQVATLRAWIDAGAKMPGEEAAAASLRLKTEHWSFQPVKRPAVTKTGGEIDELVLAKLREKGLTPSPSADRATLIRRVYLVMHGMPPTPMETADFVNDTRTDAYARLVDRVLASPRYGERWARHWMDVVRYADTNGFETNRERKSAYHYRDYIIASLNSDKPYDKFIKEQIAGDALGVDAATGFLVAGPHDVVKSPDINLTLMQRQDELADMVNTTGTAFLGLTMGCARCHNHKFDPILQKDYYAMQAVFAGVNHGERALREKTAAAAGKELASLKSDETAKNAQLDALRKKAAAAGSATAPTAPGKLRPPVNARLNEETFPPTEAVAVKFTILATNSAEPCIDELEIYDASGRNVALAEGGAIASASGTLPGYAIHKLEHINDGKTGNEHSWISNTMGQGWVQIGFPAKARIQRIVWSRDRDVRCADRVPTQYRIEVATESGKWTTVASSEDRQPFNAKGDPGDFFAKLPASEAAAARQLQADLAASKTRIDKFSENAWVGNFSSAPERTYRLYRGEPMQKREVVAPDALTVTGTLGLAVDEPDQQRRVRLADWIASPQNPLTARVLVNRLWHYTFGNGIVDTPSDFGANGSRPTHPELLDWLADEFVKGGWSIKHIQRLILMSATFRQSSAPRADAAAVDADGRLLWRYTPRRLEAEAIRDSMLAVSGALDLKMGGPGFYLMDVVTENVMHYFPKEKYTPAEYRRMVYLFRIRAAQDGVFGSFDCPDGGSVMAKRSRSNTPLQALNLFNSSFITQQSDLLAKRLRTEAGEAPDAQAAFAFRLFYARPPDAYEQRNSAEMIRTHGLQSFARALYNTSEFLFVF